MDIPRLQIESSPARISIRNGRPDLSIKTPPLDVHIDSSPARIELSRTPGSIEIDYTRARASMGYFTPTGFSDRIQQLTDKLRSEGIARIVEKGDYLADVAHHPNGVAAWSRSRMVQHATRHEFGIAALPKDPPEINIQPSNLGTSSTYRPPSIQIGMRKPMIDVRIRENEFSVIPPSLRIFVSG
ncbi:MAG: hypothetical protein H7A35_03345 [Planctomycetales bacterium]|nr:hypothetical protein [bacterium]UNM09090.1 MAG: hypothetical protein H7A35_03345 [Planctomycetales bacterium]